MITKKRIAKLVADYDFGDFYNKIENDNELRKHLTPKEL